MYLALVRRRSLKRLRLEQRDLATATWVLSPAFRNRRMENRRPWLPGNPTSRRESGVQATCMLRSRGMGNSSGIVRKARASRRP